MDIERSLRTSDPYGGRIPAGRLQMPGEPALPAVAFDTAREDEPSLYAPETTPDEISLDGMDVRLTVADPDIPAVSFERPPAPRSGEIDLPEARLQGNREMPGIG